MGAHKRPVEGEMYETSVANREDRWSETDCNGANCSSVWIFRKLVLINSLFSSLTPKPSEVFSIIRYGLAAGSSREWKLTGYRDRKLYYILLHCIVSRSRIHLWGSLISHIISERACNWGILFVRYSTLYRLRLFSKLEKQQQQKKNGRSKVEHYISQLLLNKLNEATYFSWKFV